MSELSIAIHLELQYAQAMAELNGLYHNYESSLPNISISEAELAEFAAYEALARDTALQAQIEPGAPLGRLVI